MFVYWEKFGWGLKFWFTIWLVLCLEFLICLSFRWLIRFLRLVCFLNFILELYSLIITLRSIIFLRLFGSILFGSICFITVGNWWWLIRESKENILLGLKVRNFLWTGIILRLNLFLNFWVVFITVVLNVFYSILNVSLIIREIEICFWKCNLDAGFWRAKDIRWNWCGSANGGGWGVF